MLAQIIIDMLREHNYLIEHHYTIDMGQPEEIHLVARRKDANKIIALTIQDCAITLVTRPDTIDAIIDPLKNTYTHYDLADPTSLTRLAQDLP